MTTAAKSQTVAILDLFLTIGMMRSTWMAGKATYAAKITERFVTVKGFAENELPADLVIWPSAYSANRGRYSPEQKVVCIVTTIQYYLVEIRLRPITKD